MSKNPGKKFEEDFKNSVPEEWFCYRLRDSSGNWSRTDHTRFTPSNICDFFLHTGRFLYGIELKSFKGKSMSYNNLSDKKDKKLNSLCDMGTKDGCCGAFILNFRDLNETYFFEASCLKNIRDRSDRKSLSIKEAKRYGVLIPQKIKKVRYKYFLKGSIF